MQRRSELIAALRGDEVAARDRPKMIESLAALEQFLGYVKAEDKPMITGDPVVDEWERALLAGEPLPASFNKGLVKPRQPGQASKAIHKRLLKQAEVLKDEDDRGK